MAELNPPLGTTTPEIFLDNVKRADELVNGPAGTVDDRGGEPLDTWRQMMAKNDEVRQNLIPLSKQYATLAAAQADIANIPESSSTYVRSPDSSALADEYMNVAGTLTATGRKMPSQAAIQAVLDYISSLIATDDADSPLLTLNDEAGFRLAAFGLNAIQSNAMTAEYDEFIDGFVFRDSVGFVIQQIGTPLLSSVDSVQPVVEQQRLVTEAFSAESDADISGFVFRDSVGFVLMNLNGEQSDQNNDGVDDISRRNAANLAAAAAARDEINTRIARPVYDYNILITDGQSLSNGNEGWAALSKDIRATLNINMLGDSVRPKNENGSTFTPLNGAEIRSARAVVQDLIAPPDGGNLMTDEAVAALPRGANNFGETVDIGAMWMWREMQLQFRGLATDERKIVAVNCGVGGQIIERLSKGHSWGFYNRIISAVTQIKAIADAEGKTCGVVGFLYLGNEYNYDSTKGGATDRAEYRALLRKLIDDVITDTTAITGQTELPLTVLYQTSGSWTRDSTNMSIGEAQLDICAADANVMMASPAYAVTDKGGHLDANGYRWLGMQFGKVLHRAIDRRQNWRPLQPLSVTLSGTFLRADFLVWSPPLQFRSCYVGSSPTTYAAKGFRVTDDAGDVPVTRVDIVADTVVDITLGRETTGDVYLWYASQTGSNGNGNLFDSDTTVAVANYEFHEGTGQYPESNIPELVNRPYPLNNPCVAFRRQAIAI
ncbi:flagellar biosynthesis, cell-distal portion of basal-body rod [Klebsiella pneumoniae]|nr:flagellar biosynthesis, cell-distal portion of basal-body rod [Klebsiella pneumoniae]